MYVKHVITVFIKMNFLVKQSPIKVKSFKQIRETPNLPEIIV